VKGTKEETSPGVWRLRVYAGRRPSGSPVRITQTVRGPDHKPGSGTRLADRELAKMVAAVSKTNPATNLKTFGELVTAWLDHIEADRSPTTMRKYRDIADRVVVPELGRIKLGPERSPARRSLRQSHRQGQRRDDSPAGPRPDRRCTPPGREVGPPGPQRVQEGQSPSGPRR
jgi:hypothetical protein